MERTPLPTAVIRNLGFKVGILLTLSVVLVLGFAAYVLYARGVFEETRRYVLVAADVEGVTVGMHMTFAGFPVGRVRRLSLGQDGRARIEIAVPVHNAHWLRTTSVFTLERSLVGAARLRVYSGALDDPPLPDGAVREVLRGDVTEEIPRMVATLRSALENVEQLTKGGSSLDRSLASVQTLTGRMAGPYGAVGGLLGGEAEARKVIAAIERTHALLEQLQGVARRTDTLMRNADSRLFGTDGVSEAARGAIVETGTLLREARARLEAVDRILAGVESATRGANAVIEDARAVSREVRGASADLAALRAEVEESLRRVAHLIDEVNRKWPFARKREVSLP